jgi:hypothetical protein
MLLKTIQHIMHIYSLELYSYHISVTNCDIGAIPGPHSSGKGFPSQVNLLAQEDKEDQVPFYASRIPSSKNQEGAPRQE